MRHGEKSHGVIPRMPAEQSTHQPSVAEIRAELLDFLASRLPEESELDIETDLLTDELLDSLLIMDIVAHAEATHGATLINTDIAPRNFRTVGTIANLITERRA